MREITRTISSRGRVTLPADIRRHLGIEPEDRVTFVIHDDGTVQLRRATYPTHESLVGAAGTLPRPMEWREMLEIAREDYILRKFGPRD